MGKFVNGMHGPFVGKVGNMIGSTWRGIHYLKGRSIRRKPPTEGEKLNRFIFKKTQEWLYPLTDFLRVGFKNYTPTNQGVNAAKSYLHKHALIKNGYDTTIDPALMKVSHGNLPLPKNLQAELTDSDLTVTWDHNSKDRDYEDDQVMILAYDIENFTTAMTINGQFRKTGKDVLDLTGSSTETFVVYAAFNAADRESQSDSVYLGTFSRNIPKQKPRTVSKKAQQRLLNSVDGETQKTPEAAQSAEKNTLEANRAVAQAPQITTEAKESAHLVKESLSETQNPIEEIQVPSNQLSLFDSFFDTSAQVQASVEVEVPTETVKVEPQTISKNIELTKQNEGPERAEATNQPATVEIRMETIDSQAIPTTDPKTAVVDQKASRKRMIVKKKRLTVYKFEDPSKKLEAENKFNNPNKKHPPRSG